MIEKVKVKEEEKERNKDMGECRLYAKDLEEEKTPPA